MIISIIPDQIGTESYSEKWCEFIQNKGHNIQLVNFSEPNLLQNISLTDGLMWRTAHNPDDKQKARRLLYVVEKYLNIPVYPDHNTYWHYDDKVSQFYLFKAMHIPTPQTWVFWNESQAVEWAKSAKYPVVHKLAIGASSKHVTLITSVNEAIEQIKNDFKGTIPGLCKPYKFELSRTGLRTLYYKILDIRNYLKYGKIPSLPKSQWQVEKNYSYFQEFIPNNPFDTRVNIIGDRAFAFRRWNREDDFRASGSGKLDYARKAIDMECVHIAFEVSKKCKFQSMAYDFLLADSSPVISEISYTYVDFAVYNCPGHWDSDLNWHEGHMWPEEAQVEDFIKRIEAHKLDNG